MHSSKDEHGSFDEWCHGFQPGSPPGYVVHQSVEVKRLDSITWEARCRQCDRAMVSNDRGQAFFDLFKIDCEDDSESP